VLVFFHGGGLINGSGDQTTVPCSARKNGIVVVSFNYRLDVFGFLGHPPFWSKVRAASSSSARTSGG
jgi:para-nitrobenzyl esterase